MLAYELKTLISYNLHFIKNCGADWIRTSDLRSASAMLFQLSYNPELVVGFEPTTFSLQMRCSTNWATQAFVELTGIEPATYAVQVRRSSYWANAPSLWRDLNSRHSHYKWDALPTELHKRILIVCPFSYILGIDFKHTKINIKCQAFF